MKRTRLHARDIRPDDDLRFDDLRRLRNALLALMIEDPRGWLWWVERHISKTVTLRSARVMVERQARLLVVKKYKFMHRSARQGLIYGDYYFADDGALKLYL